MSAQMKRSVSLAIFGILVAGLVQPVSAQKPLAIYVLDLDTNIKGEHHTLAVDLATSIETAFSQRGAVFKVLERRKLNEIAHQYKMEMQAFSRGEPSSPQFIKQLFSQADAVLRGELKDDGLGSVVLTISLTKFDSEKLWQSPKKIHKLLEWLHPEQQTKDAEELAADAAAKLNDSGKSASHIASDDAARGIELTKQGHCPEAMPYLKNAAAVDSKNTDVFYQMGRCQNQAGEYELALDSLRSAIETNKQRSELFIERAISFSALKDFQPALRDLDQALNIDPGNLAAIELRGDISMQRGRYADAVSAYYAVHQQQPTSSRCKKLADAYLKNGARDAAATLARTCGPPPDTSWENREIQELRSLVAGLRYNRVLSCIVIPKPAQRPQPTYVGCNEEEQRHRNNWVMVHMPPVQWDFPEDGTARLWFLVGFPEPGGGMRWTCGRDERGREQPAWFRKSQNWMSVLFSCDRPPSEADFRSPVRYSYNDLSIGR